VQVANEESGCKIKTRGLEAFSVRSDHMATSVKLRIDRQSIRLPDLEETSPGARVHFARQNDRWRIADAPESDSIGISFADGFQVSGDWSGVKSSALPGPVMDLRWDRVAVVPGTLGDDLENAIMSAAADSIGRAWTTGADAVNPHPGDRTYTCDVPIRADHEWIDSVPMDAHLVVIGQPRTNLLLARLRAHLPCKWREAPSGFGLEGDWYDDPDDVGFFLLPNPESPGRYLFVVTANDPEALLTAAKTPTAYFPDYLVARRSRVLTWGFFGATWGAEAL
jgi:hypothetical protein